VENNLSFAYNENPDTYYSIEAEQAVLGSILMKPEVLSSVTVIIKPEHFYLPQHRAIFGTIITLDATRGGNIDPLLVLNALKGDKVFSDTDGKNYLYQLAESVPTTANVESYAKIIKEKFYVRSLVDAAKGIIESASDASLTAENMLDAAEQSIYDIRKGTAATGPALLKDIIVNVYGRLLELTGPNREELMGLPSGFEELDKVTTGLNKSDLILIGARPAMGKTSFALNLARNVAVKSRKRVLFFSLEMSKEQLAQRVLATEARVSSQKMRNGRISPKEWDQLLEASTFLSQCQLYFDDTSNITVPEMKARIRRLGNVECIVVDYLQLMQSAKRTENRVQEVSEITRSLKLMAKDMMIPVITCAQLARGTEQRGKSHKPQLSDLRESGSIEQDADIVIMLYREDYYADADDGEPNDYAPRAQLLVQKNRHGPTGIVEMNWNPEFTLFSTIDRTREDLPPGE
jgi:replicative DNA helicase